jgi:hypothetical protein
MLRRINLNVLLRRIVALVFPFGIVTSTQVGEVSAGNASVVRETGWQQTLHPWC